MESIVTLQDEAGTNRFGAQFAQVLRPGDLICLKGPLGAGKTALARSIISAIGDNGDVPSPTYTLVETYDSTRGPIWHFDLYRIESPSDVWELGIEEAFGDGICLIEWPERISSLLPNDCVTISIHILEKNARQLAIKAPPEFQNRLNTAGIIQD